MGTDHGVLHALIDRDGCRSSNHIALDGRISIGVSSPREAGRITTSYRGSRSLTEKSMVANVLGRGHRCDRLRFLSAFSRRSHSRLRMHDGLGLCRRSRRDLLLGAYHGIDAPCRFLTWPITRGKVLARVAAKSS